MRDNNPTDQMGTSAQQAMFSWRIQQATETLNSRDSEQITALVIARLENGTDQSLGLPVCGRDEEASAIFVDVIRFNKDDSLADKLRFGAFQALRKVALTPDPNAEVLGELCYLVAGIRATESLDILPKIIRETHGLRKLWTGEEVRHRALRALIGLIAVEPRRRTAELKQLLQQLSHDAECRILALTGLVGLWPDEMDLSSLSEQDRNQLALSLDFAGFNSTQRVRAV